MNTRPKKKPYVSKAVAAATPLAAAPLAADAVEIVADAPEMTAPAREAPAAEVTAPALEMTAPAAEVTAPVAVEPEAPVHVEAEMPLTAEAVASEAKALIADAQEQVLAVQDHVAAALKKSIAENQQSLDKVKATAEDLTAGVETSMTTLTKGMSELNSKAYEAFRTNAEAAVEHLKALFAAKSLPEAIQLQAEHGRKQFETLSAQTRELSAAASKFASDAAAPLKQKIEKALMR